MHALPCPAHRKCRTRRAVLEPCSEPQHVPASARPAPPSAPPLRHAPWPVSTLRPTCRALSSPPCRLTPYHRSPMAGTTGSHIARALGGLQCELSPIGDANSTAQVRRAAEPSPCTAPRAKPCRLLTAVTPTALQARRAPTPPCRGVTAEVGPANTLAPSPHPRPPHTARHPLLPPLSPLCRPFAPRRTRGTRRSPTARPACARGRSPPQTPFPARGAQGVPKGAKGASRGRSMADRRAVEWGESFVLVSPF